MTDFGVLVHIEESYLQQCKPQSPVHVIREIDEHHNLGMKACYKNKVYAAA